MDLPSDLQRTLLQYLPADEIIALTVKKQFPPLSTLQYDSILRQDFGYTNFLEDIKELKTQDTFERFKKEVFFQQSYVNLPINFLVRKGRKFPRDAKKFNKEFARKFHTAKSITAVERIYNPIDIKLTDSKGNVDVYLFGLYGDEWEDYDADPETPDPSDEHLDSVKWFKQFPMLASKLTIIPEEVEGQTYLLIPSKQRNIKELTLYPSGYNLGRVNRFSYKNLEKLTLVNHDNEYMSNTIENFITEIKKISVPILIFEYDEFWRQYGGPIDDNILGTLRKNLPNIKIIRKLPLI